MLVAHQMGGGKTLTALMYLNNFPRSKHVILCPYFLKELYDRESRRLLGKPLRPSVLVLAYAELQERLRSDPEILDKAVLVMDEAHYLVELFHSMGARQFQQLYNLLMSAPKKCLALTGTPIQSSVKDLRLLINLCAGKEVLPLKESDFIKIFTRPKYFNTLFYGYFVSGLTSMWTSVVVAGAMVYMGLSINKKISVVDGLAKFSLTLFENLAAHSEGAMSISRQSFEIFMSVFLKSVPGQSYGAAAESRSYADFPDFPGIPDIGLERDEMKNLVRFVRDANDLTVVNSSALLREKSEVAKSMWAKYLKDPQTHPLLRSLGSKKGETFLAIVLISLSFVVIRSMIYMLNLLHVRVSSNHDPMFYRALNYDALKTAVAPYLSFYKLKPCSNGIPSTKERCVYVMYNAHQTKMWTRLVHNHLSPNDLKDLGFSTDTLDYTSGILNASDLEVTPESYENWGRMISNSSPPGAFPPKFETCFDLMCSPWDDKVPHGAVVYSDFAKGTQDVLKFLQHKAASKGRPFRVELFSAKIGGAKMMELMEDFSNQKVNVIVLDAGLYEGFSFRRASQMHILDPPQNYKNLAQLMGRVVRMHSHDGLPPRQQTVEYFHYVATFTPTFGKFLFNTFQVSAGLVHNKLGYLTEFLKIWKESDTYKQKLPSSFKPTIIQTLTPEALAYSRLQPLVELVHNIETTISSKVTLPAMQCCPTYVTEGESEHCLANHLAPCNTE